MDLYSPLGKYLYAINKITVLQQFERFGERFPSTSERGTKHCSMLSAPKARALPTCVSMPRGILELLPTTLVEALPLLRILEGGMLGAAVDSHRDTGSIGSKHASDAPGSSLRSAVIIRLMPT